MNTIRVKAAPGVKVPREGAPREYITDAQAVDVPASAYYLRRLDDGDLERVTDAAQALPKEAPDGQ
ncbi:hypothetical protein NNJEOMEG_02269 [Fundidesulfovibrio magnetotacticus]|uniref:DUF2635 domain-containing protein n=1 Tax=Fundidesulfovibrio magnetotacticus TaxID=2730080 RepID=A0A6V8LRS3_9BACT|nr:DUF2635 domain-containing protein [Fundidesulfovibrio magnetotacticus]GFK94424.1 hypothetical protein NNJEOMEG_02269 [Fundidesulfovibrio magnetotacticus]